MTLERADPTNAGPGKCSRTVRTAAGSGAGTPMPVDAALDCGDVLDQQLRACSARHHEFVRPFVDEVDDEGTDAGAVIGGHCLVPVEDVAEHGDHLRPRLPAHPAQVRAAPRRVVCPVRDDDGPVLLRRPVRAGPGAPSRGPAPDPDPDAPAIPPRHARAAGRAARPAGRAACTTSAIAAGQRPPRG